MSKTFLPKAQAAALEEAIRDCGRQEVLTIQAKIRFQDEEKYAWPEYLSALNEMSFETICYAVLNGFETEVEKEIQVGDWIKVDHNTIGEVSYLNGETIKYEYLAGFNVVEHTCHTNMARPATVDEIAEEEKCRKWALIKRFPGTLKIGDGIIVEGVIYNISDDRNSLADDLMPLSEARVHYESGEIEFLYPLESRLKL